VKIPDLLNTLSPSNNHMKQKIKLRGNQIHLSKENDDVFLTIDTDDDYADLVLNKKKRRSK